MAKEEIKVGDKVVFNALKDATVFDVTLREGPFKVGVKQAGRNFSEQFVDASLCKKPTREQLANYAKELASL